MPCEVDSQRPGGRAGRRILRDPVAGREHPDSPPRAFAGEDDGADVPGQLRERRHIGVEPRHVLDGCEPHERVTDAVVVEEHGKLGPLDPERRQELLLVLVRLRRGKRLAHPAEHDSRPLALEANGNDAPSGEEADLLELERPAEHERRPEHGMPGEVELAARGEDPDADVRLAPLVGRVDVDRLRQVELARKRLELLLRDVARVGEDREAVARQRRVREDVAEDVAEGAGHGVSKSARVPSLDHAIGLRFPPASRRIQSDEGRRPRCRWHDRPLARSGPCDRARGHSGVPAAARPGPERGMARRRRDRSRRRSGRRSRTPTSSTTSSTRSVGPTSPSATAAAPATSPAPPPRQERARSSTSGGSATTRPTSPSTSAAGPRRHSCSRRAPSP